MISSRLKTLSVLTYLILSHNLLSKARDNSQIKAKCHANDSISLYRRPS